MQQHTTTRSAWVRRTIARTLERLQTRATRYASLRELDARALADIGVGPSEIDSIEAEAHGRRSDATRRRIVCAGA